MRTIFLSIVLSALSLPAFALTDDQRLAANFDAALGVAETECGVTMIRPAYKKLEAMMHPNGFDQEAKQHQLMRQDHWFAEHARDPAAFCSFVLREFGPDGKSAPGIIQQQN